jgi:hypothetical protein
MGSSHLNGEGGSPEVLWPGRRGDPLDGKEGRPSDRCRTEWRGWVGIF